MTSNTNTASLKKDTSLSQTMARRHLLETLGAFAQSGPPEIEVVQYAYRVDWGAGVQPRYHHVNKRRVCDCHLGRDCPSVEAVRGYLARGGDRAPDYPEDFWPTVPEHCPICRNPCVAHPAFNFKGHGVGWACIVGGTLHYWEVRTVRIKKALAAQKGQPRWVIPPAYSATGEVLYPGVTFEDMELARIRARTSHQVKAAHRYYVSE